MSLETLVTEKVKAVQNSEIEQQPNPEALVSFNGWIEVVQKEGQSSHVESI